MRRKLPFVTLINAVFFVLIIIVMSYFIEFKTMIGPVFIVLGFVTLIPLFIGEHFHLESSFSDILFGIIDNGIFIISALIGADLAGILGAIVGGAVGNAISDAIGGIFEGKFANWMKNRGIPQEREALYSSIGKLAGCLFGAGIVLLIVWTILGL
ncbi:MAG: hypothetical protein GTN38_03975 [Candidatus Aenigmarchaeota archaeon]|nr:hypothetical protein [Candidatus Aenigmarchaeota archaeon]NIP40820.1 hypothetical protein [Candidatus Aenigmarchaeota archaeon]NIQ17934.1 hypothetical protein [Candidatus Aenigmarchaeota archaeon]NIS73523.1 hypothetical protein [Candidatus Aenigmarchaeota archaeon]